MPTASMCFETTINAEPETVFDYISDLTRHGEWAGNPLSIAPVEDSQPITVGQRYRSKADVGKLHFEAELAITKLDPPHQFAFRGSDATGEFHHTFTITPATGNLSGHSTVHRQFDFTLTVMQWVMFYVLYFPVRRPAALKALARLKAQLES